MIKPKLNKKYKTTKGFIAHIVEEVLRGEFTFKAIIYDSTGLDFDNYAYYNYQGKVQGMQTYYGNLSTEIINMEDKKYNYKTY